MKPNFKAIVASCLLTIVSCGVQAQSTSSLPSDTSLPKFPTGDAGFREYMTKHLHFPADAFKELRQGVTVVKFVVRASGEVDSVQVEKYSYPSFDNEAFRVVRKMPKWEPAIKDGKPTSCWFSLPVTFKFSNVQLDFVVQDKQTKELFVSDGTVKPLNFFTTKRTIDRSDLDLTVTSHDGTCSQRLLKDRVMYVRVDPMFLKDSTNFIRVKNPNDHLSIKEDGKGYILHRGIVTYQMSNHHDLFLEARNFCFEGKKGDKNSVKRCSLPFFKQGDEYYFDGKLYRRVD